MECLQYKIGGDISPALGKYENCGSVLAGRDSGRKTNYGRGFLQVDIGSVNKCVVLAVQVQ